jgi:hypothetical protein
MPKKPAADPSKKYEVGYGRPPKSSQWKRGESGNPGGKKKGAKNGATILNEIMQRKVRITEQGRSRKISVHQGLYLKYLDPALKGNLKAAAYLIDKHEAVQTQEAEREAARIVVPRITKGMTDQEAIDAYALMIQNPNAVLED